MLQNGQDQMKRSKSKIKKLIYIRTTLLIMLGYFFLFGEIVTFEKTQENYFHLQLNSVDVGTIGEIEKAEELLIEARKNLAAASEELLLLEAELTSVGEVVLWGEVDSDSQVIAAMEEVLKDAVQESVRHSYTVKVNEYTVSLGSKEEVQQMLQAAVSRYDSENRFQVQLVQDNAREFHVLTAKVKDTAVETVEQEETDLFPEAGFAAHISQVIEEAEPEVELGFEDYELGLKQLTFSDEVEIVEAYLPQNQLASVDQAVEELIKEHETETFYEVVAGDTLSEISIKVDIPMEELIAMNDSLENENSMIRIGDELLITVPEPELSVTRQEQSYIEEIYDADIIYVDNDNWYTTQTKTLQQPSAGFRKIIAVSTYLDDKLVEREVIKEEVVAEAVPKIVERGTRIPPTYIKPISGGRLSSSFGKRARPTKGASTYHKGVDWAVPKGTAVRASCGGTVARAGWGSGYGYVVYINHEDGRQTRYAHLSKVLVSVGQTVKQGDKIALSGNTGVSSGPHLHFEILIGGKQVDPFKYLN